jgi:PilZ domain
MFQDPVRTMMSNVRVLRRSPGCVPGARRMRANWPALLKSGDRRAACRLIDISRDGASVAGTGPVDPDGPAWLIVNHVPLLATVAWRKGDRIGLSFREPQRWLEQACAERFDPTAWVSL